MAAIGLSSQATIAQSNNGEPLGLQPRSVPEWSVYAAPPSGVGMLRAQRTDREKSGLGPPAGIVLPLKTATSKGTDPS